MTAVWRPQSSRSAGRQHRTLETAGDIICIGQAHLEESRECTESKSDTSRCRMLLLFVSLYRRQLFGVYRRIPVSQTRSSLTITVTTCHIVISSTPSVSLTSSSHTTLPFSPPNTPPFQLKTQMLNKSLPPQTIGYDETAFKTFSNAQSFFVNFFKIIQNKTCWESWNSAEAPVLSWRPRLHSWRVVAPSVESKYIPISVT